MGRASEWAALSELLEEARRGCGGALVLRGDFGYGLTALLDATAAESDGMRVVRACGVRSEQTLHLAALHQLCASLRDMTSAIGGQEQEALAQAFESGGLVAADRFAVGRALIELLRAAAGEHVWGAKIRDAPRETSDLQAGH